MSETIIDDRLMHLHPGDEVKVFGPEPRLRRINLHNHFCTACRVEEVRTLPYPSGLRPHVYLEIKLTCGYVAPVTLLKFISCPHVASVPAVHAFINFKVVCGANLKSSTRFSARENRWTCKKCIRKLAKINRRAS